MCEEASFIIVKGHRAVWSPYTDSHSEIRRERGPPENACGRVDRVMAGGEIEALYGTAGLVQGRVRSGSVGFGRSG